MNDYVKEKLIKSIIEADLIIEEINNQQWENKFLRILMIIIILGLGFFMTKMYYESKENRMTHYKSILSNIHL